MKQSLMLCILLLSLSCLCFAASPSPVSVGASSPPQDVEIRHLIQLIDDARSAGQEPEEAWFDRLDELTGESAGRGRTGGSLDRPAEGPSAISIQAVRQGGEACDDAFTIPGLPFSESGTLGNTDNCVGQPYRDVFYRYTAIQNGSHTFDMCGSSGDTYLRLWTAGTCCVGTSVTNDNGCGTDYDPTLTLTLTNGQTVIIECGKYSDNIASPYLFHAFGPVVPPANDLCNTAQSVTVPSSTMGTTLNAAVDAAPACGTAGAPVAAGVWYWVNGTGNRITASLCNVTTTWNTRLSVYTGPCTSLGCVDGNDDYCDIRSQVSWCSSAGIPYFILVHGAATSTGAFQLDISDNGINCHLSCVDTLACGSPAETEPNDQCPLHIDPLVIACPADDTASNPAVYGTICPATDHDIYRVLVLPKTMMTLTILSGAHCDSLLTGCITADLRNGACNLLSSNTSGVVTLNNTGAGAAIYNLDVHGNGTCITRYKITALCCSIVDYAANPIHVPPTFDYETTVNTCCATASIPFVYSQGCAGAHQPAGSAVIFRIMPPGISHVQITATGGNPQLMVFTDPANPTGTCVASADTSAGNTEILSDLLLNGGMYFLSVSRAGTDCGDIALTILSDVLLPVNLQSFLAEAGAQSVTLRWQTASETDNDHFELMRDDRRIATVPTAGNGPSGHRYSFDDDALENGRLYHYDLYAVAQSGVRSLLKSVTAILHGEGGSLVTRYALQQNFPNPFNPSTDISFDLLDPGTVTLRVYDLLGRQVAELVNGSLDGGHHQVRFDAANLPSGVYLYRIEVNHFVAQQKMLLMK